MTNWIALGDSNTGNSYNPYYVTSNQTYFKLISDQFGLTAINAGVSGNKASDMLARLTTVMALGSSGDIVSVCSGTNEADESVTNSTTTASIRAAYREDMSDIIDTLQTNGFKPVIFTAPDSLLLGMRPRLEALRQEAHEIGIKYGVPVIDINAKMIFDLNSVTFSTYKDWFKDNSGTPDNYHMEVTGHQRWADFSISKLLDLSGVGGGPTTYPQTILNRSFNSGFGNTTTDTTRTQIKASALTAKTGSPTQTKVTFAADVSESFTVTSAYIGHKATSGDAWDFSSTPVQLMVSSSGTFTVPQNSTVTTDLCGFVWDGSSDIIVSIYCSGGPSSDFLAAFDDGINSGSSLYVTHLKAASDASTVNASGYSSYPGYCSGVTKIDME